METAQTDVEEPEAAQYLVAGNDPGINYNKLAQALAAILAGAKSVATNEGRLKAACFLLKPASCLAQVQL